MKKIRRAIPWFTILALALPSGAEESDAAKPKPDDSTKQVETVQAPNAAPGTVEPVDAPPPPERKLEYRPPGVGKPARSVGGGSRGVRDRIPLVYVLVPDHVGQTRSAQPSLFWFIDRLPDSSARIEFTLLAADQEEPVFETQLKPPDRVGIHRIRLSDLGVKLEPGTEYEWSVAVVMDAGDPSKDVVATGWIDRVERPELDARLRDAGADGAVYILAEEGLWYDALAELGDDLDRSPSDAKLRSMQASLLEQVGLGTLTKGAM